jgi:alkyl sulfatase BDS1-like metallo-beta-lactamase superfamily hydrolase
MALKASGSSLVSDENMYRVRDGAVRDMGLGLPSEYYTDPATQEPQPPPPDPEMAKAQAQATIEAEKVKVESEKAQRADQLKADQLAVSREVQLADVQEKAAITRWEAEQKANREMAAREAEAALAVERQQFDMALATRRAEFDMALAEKQAKAKSDEAGLPKYRPGGDLDK